MKLHIIKVLAGNEVRVRLRRLSTLVTIFSVVVLSWLMVPAPDSGMTLISLNDARVLNTSSALAFGTASLAAIIFGLGSFYLTRGRTSEDIRSGVGSVIAASQISNGLFIAARWIGGVVYMLALNGAMLATTLVLHLIRGDGPVEITVYLQVYGLLLLPMIFFGVSCATLFDSFSFLMGKAGDVLFFFVWIFQIALMSAFDDKGTIGFSPLMLIDFSGLGAGILTMQQLVHSSNLSIGVSEYNTALPAITLPHIAWPLEVIFARFGSALLALVPLLPAVWKFHRYSPDRVKVSAARHRRSPIAILNGWLRPISRVVHPMFRLAGKLPGITGQIIADIALTFVTSPLAIVLVLFFAIGALLASAQQLPALLIAAVVYWGILISDISTRDHAANAENIAGTAQGGKPRRYLRQFIATNALGFLFMGAFAFRWYAEDPQRALAVISGIVFLSSLALAFGRFSRTPRTFIALFLFGMYVALNGTDIAILDMVGFNGSADMGSMAMQMMVAGVAMLSGYFYNRQQAK
jgi:hypothetical protein